MTSKLKLSLLTTGSELRRSVSPLSMSLCKHQPPPQLPRHMQSLARYIRIMYKLLWRAQHSTAHATIFTETAHKEWYWMVAAAAGVVVVVVVGELGMFRALPRKEIVKRLCRFVWRVKEMVIPEWLHSLWMHTKRESADTLLVRTFIICESQVDNCMFVYVHASSQEQTLNRIRHSWSSSADESYKLHWTDFNLANYSNSCQRFCCCAQLFQVFVWIVAAHQIKYIYSRAGRVALWLPLWCPDGFSAVALCSIIHR